MAIWILLISSFRTVRMQGIFCRNSISCLRYESYLERVSKSVDFGDIPISDNPHTFNDNYLKLKQQVAESCTNHDLTDSLFIGTSALAKYEIDGAVGMYGGLTCDLLQRL